MKPPDEIDSIIIDVLEEYSHIHLSAVSIKRTIERRYEKEVSVSCIARHIKHVEEVCELDITETMKKKYKLIQENKERSK